MRIAYLSSDFGVPVGGRKGASIHVGEMVRALQRAGAQMTLFSPSIDAAARSVGGELEGARLVAIEPESQHVGLLEELRRIEDGVGSPSRLRPELRNLLYNIPFLRQTRDVLTRHPVDVVYERYTLFGYAGGRLARELGVPHLLEVNAPLAEEQEKTRGLELKALAQASERQILCDADAVIVVSDRLREFALACGVGGSRIHVIPNGVDPRRFERAPACDPLPPDVRRRIDGRRVIGFVGSLKPWHGIETLVEAFHLLHARRRDLHLLLVGDGPGRDPLSRQVKQSGLEDDVTMTGAVPYDAIPRYLEAFDVAVAPYTPSDNFYFSPIKIFEYMAAGRPVVAGAIGQVAELLVDGENALLFAPGRIGELCDRLDTLVRDDALRQRIAAHGRAWVARERTWDGNARRVIEIAEALRASGAETAACGASRSRP